MSVNLLEELQRSVRVLIRSRNLFDVDFDEAVSRAALQYALWARTGNTPNLWTCAWRGIHDELRRVNYRFVPMGDDIWPLIEHTVPAPTTAFIEVSWFLGTLTAEDRRLLVQGPPHRNSTQAQRASRLRRVLKNLMETTNPQLSTGVSKPGPLLGRGVNAELARSQAA